MMLHRHFEKENQREKMTTLSDITPKPEYVSKVFPPEEVVDEAPTKKRGRPKKSEE